MLYWFRILVFVSSLSRVVLSLNETRSATAYNVIRSSSSSLNNALYGNWCGISDYGGADENADAIDSLDKICHDLYKCYKDYGLLNCGCNIDLARAIDHQGHKLSQESRAIATFYLMRPCIGPQQSPCPSHCGARCSGLECKFNKDKGIYETCAMGQAVTAKVLDVKLPYTCKVKKPYDDDDDDDDDDEGSDDDDSDDDD